VKLHTCRSMLFLAILSAPEFALGQYVAEPTKDSSALEHQIDEAADEFNADIEQVFSQLAEAIDVRLDRAIEAGNLDEAVALREAKEQFQSNGEPPSGTLLKTTVDRSRREVSRAASKLTSSYRRFAREYVRSGDVDTAQRILEEQAQILASVSSWLAPQSRRPQAPKPVSRAVEPRLASAASLQQSLAGSVWMHRYRNGNFEFAFGKDGTVQVLRNWAGTRWAVTGPREVTFTATTGATMKFMFNDEITSYTNIDWDGITAASGTRTDRTLP